MKQDGRFGSVMKVLVVFLVAVSLMQAWPGAAFADGLNQWASGFAAQGLDGTVRALAVDGSGNLYAGGDFRMAGEVAVSFVARRDAASGAWAGLSSGMDAPVYALALDAGGNLYAGGYFATAGGVTASHVARWDGSTWSALGDPGGNVATLVVDGAGTLYAGGSFAGGVKRWDAQAGTWSAVGYVTQSVYALAFDGSGTLYVGGSFIGGVKRWDGSSWSVVGTGIGWPGFVYNLAVDAGGSLYAGGYFTAAGGVAVNNVARWDGTTWSALGSGVDGAVVALAVDGAGSLYAGGTFGAAGGVPAGRVARWDGSTWGALGGGADDVVNALALDAGGGLYAGGRFQVAGGSVANYVALWAGGGWSGLGSGGSGQGMGSSVAAVAVDSGNLFAGGYFTTAGDVLANRVARWDGSAWSDLGGGVDGPVSPGVFALALDGSGNLYAGGRFTTAGGVEASNVARWDGAQWHALGSGVDGYVKALAVDAGGNLYAGGDFTTAGGVMVSKIARWDPLSETWSDVGGGVGGSYPYVSALVFDGSGALYAGGSFATAGGVAANNVARWDPASGAWSALGDGLAGADPYVDALAVDGASLYAGGSFSTAGATAVSNIARWDGSAWSALGSGLGAAEVDYVEALAVGGCGGLYAGGWFATAGGVAASNVARWDGSTWNALGSGVDSDVYALSADTGGHLHAGGGFSTAGGLPSSYIARWDTAPCSVVVTSDADSGPGTLRQAIAEVGDGGTITFAGDMTIHLASTLTLDRDVTIDGTEHSVAVSGDTNNDGDATPNVRVFNVNSGVTATLRRLTVTKGYEPGGYGGALYNNGALTVTDCTFSDNSAGTRGGAIFNNGRGAGASLTATNCTFTGNVTRSTNEGGGGAIYNDCGTLTVETSTFAGNSSIYGGAIDHWAYYGGTASVTSSTFSGNDGSSGGAISAFCGSISVRNSVFVRGTTGANCRYEFSNLTGINNLLDEGLCGAGSINSSTILLGTLGDYGGATQTIPLLPGSAAIDAGDPAFCPAADQRGMGRSGTCDIGAFESQGFALGSLTGTPQSSLVNTAFAEPLGLAVAANDPAEPVDGGLVTFTPPVDGASAALTGSPATIAGGAASVTAAANGIPGAYDITASAAGAASVAFALTNTLPQPALNAISPASAPAGSGDLSLVVTGSGFAGSSVVRWNGADLATTYLSESQLGAAVPAGSLAAVQTAQVTVHTEWGGTSSVLAFFVTEAAAGVVAQQVSSGTDPSAGVDPASAAAIGEGLLAVAQYDANPGGTPSFVANGTYFDVYAAPGNSFSQVSIAACGLNPGEKLYWWDAALDKWEKASPQSYDQATGCVTLVVDADSSPSLGQLQGTYFATGSNAAPVADPGGPYLGAVSTAIQFDGSGSSDPDGDPLTYAWDFGDGSSAEGVAPAHTYAAAGIYDVCLVVSDGTEPSPAACTLVVAYDPEGGFVTGGGWIDSPAGAYKPDPNLTGKATFGFVSKYQKGTQVPTGTTEFQFQAGGLDFHSETYEWLVVNQGGKNAQFKGSGTVNGGLDPNGNAYKFMIWAGDGSPDTLRIRIWWEGTDGLENDLYDNGVEQAIGGGSIVVHAK